MTWVIIRFLVKVKVKFPQQILQELDRNFRGKVETFWSWKLGSDIQPQPLPLSNYSTHQIWKYFQIY